MEHEQIQSERKKSALYNVYQVNEEKQVFFTRIHNSHSLDNKKALEIGERVNQVSK